MSYLTTGDADTEWLLIGAILVFFMQAGFAMLEVGSIQIKNTKNILIKNVFDASIGALVWWIIGYGIALGPGSDDGSGLVGSGDESTYYTGLHANGYADGMWLFQWAFAGAAATIVSGAVAERVTFTAYVIYSIVLTAFIYPVVVHAGWNTQGMFSAWRSGTGTGSDFFGNYTYDGGASGNLFMDCGVTDFAGSGVVHMTGGVAALVAAIVVGPRTGRFDGGTVRPLPQQSIIFQTLGCLILWMGWYGFNGVSTLYIANYSGVAAHTMVTTTISAATGCLTCSLIGYFQEHAIDPANANNGILAGLVGITAGCSTVSNLGAFIIGFSSAFVYYGASKLLLKMKIDDVVDAVPVHGCCGAWGVLMAGLFATEHLYSMAYYGNRAFECQGLFYGGGKLFGANFVFVLFVLAWVGVLSTILFVGMKMILPGGVRVALEVEEEGMDSSKHGGLVDYASGSSKGPESVMVQVAAGAEA